MNDIDWTPPGPGPWGQDRAHTPSAVTPLLQEMYPDGFSRGFGEALAPFGVLLNTLQLAYVNGFSYIQPQPFDVGTDAPTTPEEFGAEIGRRTGLAAEAFDRKIWREGLRLWDEELKPASIARHEAMAAVDLTALDTEGLRAHLHACVENLGAMWFQHHRFNAMAMIPVGDFVLHAAGWTRQPPIPILAVFDGWSPVSNVVNPEIEASVLALRNDPEARALLVGDAPADERLAALRTRVPSVDTYVQAVGHRIAAGFDLTNPTVGERPDIVLGRLHAAVDHDTDMSRTRSDALAAELRESVPAEHRAEFDELMTEARLVYRLRDERGLYSDTNAVGLMRLALIELGRRLHERDRIAFVYDTLDITRTEIDALLDGSPTPTADELRARVARRKSLSAEGAPATLGPPAPEPPPVDQLPPPLARVMSALGFVISGVLGEADAPGGDAEMVIGIAASAGVFEGPAKLVRNFDELLTIEDGDVLVTPATGESFNSFLHLVGAIVTDHGSFASHAAIMGREMGFPAVVGTVDGTKRIATGDRIRVDGAAGTVTILH